MANFCINSEKSGKCKYRFRGVVIGTKEKLCNIISKEKPCFAECVCENTCECKKDSQNG